MLPATLIPQSLAQQLGLFAGPLGTELIGGDMQEALFTEGYLGAPNHFPDDGPLGFATAHLTVMLPALDGLFEIDSVKVFINPYSDRILLGVNGLVPSDYAGWSNNDTNTFNLSAAAVPEPSSLLILGLLTGAGLLRRNRRR